MKSARDIEKEKDRFRSRGLAFPVKVRFFRSKYCDPGSVIFVYYYRDLPVYTPLRFVKKG